MIREIFYFVIFPGLLFSTFIGGILSWFDRKITARVQFRQGPPLLQPFYDLIKLLYKETILPARGSKLTFLVAPVIGLFGVTLANVFVLLPVFGIDTGFRGDLIVIFYLLTIPSLSFMVGAMASGNPLAAVGASREMKLIMSYELSFLLVIAAIFLKTGMKISLYEILAYQAVHGALIGSISGIFIFIAAIFCLQAKMGLVPFDMSEAETEINHGVFIEYSGSIYAIVKLTRYVMFFTFPAFVVSLMLGGPVSEWFDSIWFFLKVIALVLVMTLIRNTNPRLKIHQAMKFFMIWINLILLLAILLSYFNM